MRLEFEKEEDGKWYAVIPEWPYDHEELEMVDGADDLLDCLTQDGRMVTLDVETDEPSTGDYATFTLIDHDDYGGTYVTDNPKVEHEYKEFLNKALSSKLWKASKFDKQSKEVRILSEFLEAAKKDTEELEGVKNILLFLDKHIKSKDLTPENIASMRKILFDNFMTSGVIGTALIIAIFVVGFKSFKKYEVSDEKGLNEKGALITFSLIYVIYSFLCGDGNYAIFHNINKPTYMNAPFWIVLFMLVYVYSCSKNKEVITNEI